MRNRHAQSSSRGRRKRISIFNLTKGSSPVNFRREFTGRKPRKWERPNKPNEYGDRFGARNKGNTGGDSLPEKNLDRKTGAVDSKRAEGFFRLSSREVLTIPCDGVGT